ncbi:MAG: DUF1569 domain-containing protein [Chryseobacterium jejuense]|uniref:DUF1569 domain-containing protein n=1 Tax=Chryseobacterium jejuense TaxID=445960 RepID=UPI003D0EDDF5
MKTIFDHNVREELINRINLLSQQSSAQWGKMNLYQMVKHCTVWNNWVLGNGNDVYRQDLLGKIFGKMVLKKMVKDDKPLGKNSPAGIFTIKETAGETELLKESWKKQIASYANYSNPNFVHDFFGKMTKEEIGIFVYKHMDHHLRQFNV